MANGTVNKTGATRGFKLDPKLINEFYENGFFIYHNLFKPEEVQEMRAGFAGLETKAQKIRTTQMYEGSSYVLGEMGDRVRIHRIVWAGASEPVLLKYGADPRLVDSAAQILGSDQVDQLINQAHFKLPGDGVVFPWHQDYQHRNKKPGDWTDVNGRGSYVQTLMAIDDIENDNAPVLFIPGSHKLGAVELGGDGYDIPTEDEMVNKYINPATAIPTIMKAGSVIFFGPYTVHGSFANESKKARRVFINGYAAPGANARVYPGEGSGRTLLANK